jgi:hypothetical protein
MIHNASFEEELYCSRDSRVPGDKAKEKGKYVQANK